MRKYRDPAKRGEDLRRLGMLPIQAEEAPADEPETQERSLDPRLNPGVTNVANETGRPEAVLPAPTTSRRSPNR